MIPRINVTGLTLDDVISKLRIAATGERESENETLRALKALERYSISMLSNRSDPSQQQAVAIPDILIVLEALIKRKPQALTILKGTISCLTVISTRLYGEENKRLSPQIVKILFDNILLDQDYPQKRLKSEVLNILNKMSTFALKEVISDDCQNNNGQMIKSLLTLSHAATAEIRLSALTFLNRVLTPTVAHFISMQAPTEIQALKTALTDKKSCVEKQFQLSRDASPILTFAPIIPEEVKGLRNTYHLNQDIRYVLGDRIITEPVVLKGKDGTKYLFEKASLERRGEEYYTNALSHLNPSDKEYLESYNKLDPLKINMTREDGDIETLVIPKSIEVDVTAKRHIEKQCPDVAEFRLLNKIIDAYENSLETAKDYPEVYGISTKQTLFQPASSRDENPLNFTLKR